MGKLGRRPRRRGGEDPWYTGGGARQLRILDADNNPKSVADLLNLGILQNDMFRGI